RRRLCHQKHLRKAGDGKEPGDRRAANRAPGAATAARRASAADRGARVATRRLGPAEGGARAGLGRLADARRLIGAGAGVARAAAGAIEEAGRGAGTAKDPVTDLEPADAGAVRLAGAQPYRRGEERPAPGETLQGHVDSRRGGAAFLRLGTGEPQGFGKGGPEESRRRAEGVR